MKLTDEQKAEHLALESREKRSARQAEEMAELKHIKDQGIKKIREMDTFFSDLIAEMRPSIHRREPVSDLSDQDYPVRPSRPRKPRTPAQVRKLLEPKEKHEQRMLFAWAELNVARPELQLMYAIPNAGGYTGGFKNNRGRVRSAKKEGVRSGVPDVHLPVARKGWHSLYIELKRQSGGKVSPDQQWWKKHLEAEGHMVQVCKGFEEARAVIEHYLR